MVDTNDILLTILGFAMSFYGGFTQELTLVVTGMLFIFLNLTLNSQSQENKIVILQSQINTQNELKRIREEIKELKDEIHKKEGTTELPGRYNHYFDTLLPLLIS